MIRHYIEPKYKEVLLKKLNVWLWYKKWAGPGTPLSH